MLTDSTHDTVKTGPAVSSRSEMLWHGVCTPAGLNRALEAAVRAGYSCQFPVKPSWWFLRYLS